MSTRAGSSAARGLRGLTRLGSAYRAAVGTAALPLSSDCERVAAAGRGGEDFAAAGLISGVASDTRARGDAGDAAPPLTIRPVVPAGLTSARGAIGSAGRVAVVRARAAGGSPLPGGGVVESVTAPYPFDYDP